MLQFVAPKSIYQHPRMDSVARTQTGGYTMPEPIGLTKTRTGGVATIFPGHPYPRKTFVYYGITQANDQVKRTTLVLLMPLANLRYGITKFFDTLLASYNRLVDSIYSKCDQVPYLKYGYYSEFGKAFWDFIYLFLRRLGISDQVAYRTGLQVTTAVEYDDAYKVRIQDILNESSKQALLENPRKEILRLIDIYRQRETAIATENDLTHAGARIINLLKFASLVLYIPRVKKAFKFALENIDFEYFKLDEIDYYWTLNRFDYNCGGRDFVDRRNEMIEIMVEHSKKQHPGKRVQVEDNGQGQIEIKIYDQ